MLLCFPTFTVPNISGITGSFNIFTKENIEISDTTTLDSGLGYIIKGNINTLDRTLNQLDSKKICGISVEFASSTTLEKFKNKLDIIPVEIENLGEISCFYGYTSRLPLYTIVDNQRINIQIVQTDDYIKIGYPLILDGA